MKLLCLTIIVILSLIVCNAQNSKTETLTNKMVVDLVKAQFSADTIIKKIQTATSVNFDTGTDDLIKLKNSGVEEKIINAMLDRSVSSQPVRSSKPGGVEIEPYVVSGTSSSGKTQSSKEKEKVNKFSIKKKNFTFDLVGCKASGDAITCEYMVTNNSDLKKEIGTSRNNPSIITDEKGNRYKSSSNQIAGVQDNMQPVDYNISIRGKVIFEGIEQQPKDIKMLTLWVAIPDKNSWPPTIIGHDWSYIDVNFRDVPVSQ